jgi:alpha-tubulin suppressor-like RCC1 family protein
MNVFLIILILIIFNYIKAWEKLSVGYNHAILLSTNNILYGLGYNLFGNLGDKTSLDKSTPVPVYNGGDLFGKKIIQIYTGSNHNFAISDSNEIFSWGYGTFGQLCNTVTGSKNYPTKIFTDIKFKSKQLKLIALGSYNSLVLYNENELYTCGYNVDGQQGINSTTNINYPTEVINSTALFNKTITIISGGENHVICLTSNSELIGWGNGIKIPTFIQTNGLLKNKKILQISAGYGFSLALTNENEIYSWGSNTYGEMGIGDNVPYLSTALVYNKEALLNKNISKIFASKYKTGYALTSEG